MLLLSTKMTHYSGSILWRTFWGRPSMGIPCELRCQVSTETIIFLHLGGKDRWPFLSLSQKLKKCLNFYTYFCYRTLSNRTHYSVHLQFYQERWWRKCWCKSCLIFFINIFGFIILFFYQVFCNYWHLHKIKLIIITFMFRQFLISHSCVITFNKI